MIPVENEVDKILLKPCPFCGEDDLKVHVSCEKGENEKPRFPLEQRWFVSCRGDCFFAGPTSIVSQDDAVKKWNTRPHYDQMYNYMDNLLDSEKDNGTGNSSSS